MKELWTSGNAARALGVSAERIRQLEKLGRLPARKTAGGIRIFLRQDVERLAAERAARKAKGANGQAVAADVKKSLQQVFRNEFLRELKKALKKTLARLRAW